MARSPRVTSNTTSTRSARTTCGSRPRPSGPKLHHMGVRTAGGHLEVKVYGKGKGICGLRSLPSGRRPRYVACYGRTFRQTYMYNIALYEQLGTPSQTNWHHVFELIVMVLMLIDSAVGGQGSKVEVGCLSESAVASDFHLPTPAGIRLSRAYLGRTFDHVGCGASICGSFPPNSDAA